MFIIFHLGLCIFIHACVKISMCAYAVCVCMYVCICVHCNKSGFRIDPQEKLDETSKEVQSLHTLFSTSPIFGVDFTLETDIPVLQQPQQARVEEDLELLEEVEDSHAIAAYYVEGTLGEDEDSKFESVHVDEVLGLAVEGMKEGTTLESLWRVI